MFSFVTPEYIHQVVVFKNKIRKTIPSTYSAIDKYILRIVQFYSGVDSHLPMTADFYLKDWCTMNSIEFSYIGENSSKIRKEIDAELLGWCITNNVIDGAKQWRSALGH